MLKNEISINKFCPQSGLKHSVVHVYICIFVEKRFGLYRSTNMLGDTIDGKVTTVFFSVATVSISIYLYSLSISIYI